MIRDINIKPALNGWTVTVGCQTLVFNTTVDLMSQLDKYLRDPEGTEKEFLTTALNRKHTYPIYPDHVPVPVESYLACAGVVTPPGLAHLGWRAEPAESRQGGYEDYQRATNRLRESDNVHTTPPNQTIGPRGY